MKLKIIVAVDREGGFSKEGKIPWFLPEDFEHFKNITTGHVCVMGRRTYEDILETRKNRDVARNINLPIDEILRNRESYVVSRNPNFTAPGATVVKSMGIVADRMKNSGDTRKLFVIGGRRMFFEALSNTDTIHMTIIKGDKYNCDVFFPVNVLNKKFKIVSGRETEKAYFVDYNRI
jgi:dihydrofolate reductase